jgi:hypothetical protein
MTDNMNVQITSTATTDYAFKVTSTGHYRDATRKIEATLEGTGGGGGGGGPPINPGYYTPSNILIDGSVSLAGVSLYSEGNIILKGLDLSTGGSYCRQQARDEISPCNRRKVFQDDVIDSAGVFTGGNSTDPFSDWYSPEIPPQSASHTWNLVRRLQEDHVHPYTKLGFAAEGKICKPASSTATNCASTDPSVADGVYGYDSTTGNTSDPTLNNTDAPYLKSNLKQFYRRVPECSYTSCLDPNDPNVSPPQLSNKLTYPFPLVKPNPTRLKGLKGIADHTDPNYTDGRKFYPCPNAAPAACSLRGQQDHLTSDSFPTRCTKTKGSL